MNRIRVERLLSEAGYADGWIVLYGSGPWDHCIHDSHDEAMHCASEHVERRRVVAEALEAVFAGPVERWTNHTNGSNDAD